MKARSQLNCWLANSEAVTPSLWMSPKVKKSWRLKIKRGIKTRLSRKRLKLKPETPQNVYSPKLPATPGVFPLRSWILTARQRISYRSETLYLVFIRRLFSPHIYFMDRFCIYSTGNCRNSASSPTCSIKMHAQKAHEQIRVGCTSYAENYSISSIGNIYAWLKRFMIRS